MAGHLRLRHLLGGLIAALALGAAAALGADPANFSGLQGADLEPVAAMDLESLARQLLSEGDGEITRVRVAEDRAESLTLQIGYRGVEVDGSVTMVVRAEDADRRRIAAVPEQRTAIASSDGEATVTLSLSPGVPGGTRVEQAFLAVRIGEEGSIRQAVDETFRCAKVWEKSLAPEEMEITAVAEPIGKSATLPATKKLTLRPVSPAVFKAVRVAPPAATETSRPAVQAIAKTGVVLTPRTRSARLAKPTGAIAGKGIGEAATPTPTVNPALVRLRRPAIVLGLPSDVQQKEGRGPGGSYLRLFDTLESEFGLTAEDVTDVHPNIYEDANPGSGYFYYLPRGYYLYWDEDTGYALRILYGASGGEASGNTVSIAARLTSGIDPQDIVLVRSLLKEYCRSVNRTFTELRPFPFNDMAVSLKGDLGQYNIPPENISVTGISDIAGMIDISLTTDPVTKENLQMVLTQGLGITGIVTYEFAASSGGDSLRVAIPVVIRFADQHSLGVRLFARAQQFRNRSLYPMRMKYVNALVGGATPTVYSWDLGDTGVPAGAGADIDAGKIPGWVDSSALRMWVDYAVAGDDEEATQQAIEAVTGGVVSVGQSEITFRTLSPLADTGAALVLVTVSSRYFDPQGAKETVKSVELTEDGGTFTLGPIYLVNRQEGEDKPGDPLYRFKMTVVNADGTTREGATWTESNGLTVYIGEAQLRPIIGETEAGGG